MINLKYSAAFLLISSLAYAAPTLPVTYTGLDTLKTLGYSSLSSCVDVHGVECGGEFTGTLGTGGATNTLPVAINFWCVDSQEDFTFGQSGLAQVVQLSDITSDAANVRYSGVVNGTGPGTWTNTTVSTGLGTVNLPSDATARYEMAAYLVSQFPLFDGSVNGGDQKSTAIEGAIWDIMSNNAASEPPFSYFTPTSGTPVDTDIDYWIYQASQANFSAASIADDFAVISWDANSNGDGLVSNAQTFLVELDNPTLIVTHNSPTPEPGFYGVLALGLSGLFFAARRRKKA